MTVQQILLKITEFIKTGIPNNVKSSNMRALLTWIVKRISTYEFGRLQNFKASGNISENLEPGDYVTGIVEDTFFRDGIYLGGNIQLLSSYLIPGNASNPNEPDQTYENITALLANQESQSFKKYYLVTDASDDPNIETGEGVYLFLGTENEDLEQDYIRLNESDIANINAYWQTKTLRAKESSYVNYDALETGQVFAIETNGFITSLIFDIAYSKFLAKDLELLDSGNTIAFKFANTTQFKQIYAEATAITQQANNSLKVDFAADAIPTLSIFVGDVLQLGLPQVVGGEGGAQTLDEVLANDNISERNAKIGELELYDIIESEYAKIKINNSELSFIDALGRVLTVIEDGNLTLKSHTSGFDGALQGIDVLTSDRKYTLPDKNIVFAGLEDLEGITSGYQGKIEITDTPTEDGFYIASETGTYTNAGDLEIDLDDGVNIIVVSETQTVFSKIVVPIDVDITPDGEVEENEIRSVTGDKIYQSIKYKADLIVGKNKFNKDNVLENHLLTPSGALNSNSTYSVSEYIAVIVGQEYSTNANIRYTCYFDVDKNIVPGGSTTNTTTFTPPSNVAYAKVTVYNSTINTLQIEEGASSTSFSPFETFINKYKIKTTSEVVEGDEIDAVNSKAIEDYVNSLDFNAVETFYPNPLDPSKVEQGYFAPTTGNVNTNNSTYWYYNGRINVSAGNKIRVFKSNGIDPSTTLTIRSIASFDSDGNILSGSGSENQFFYIVPTNAVTVSFSLYKSQVDSGEFSKLLFSDNGLPKIFEPYQQVINPTVISKTVNQTLKGASILSYSDSITDEEDEYISYLHKYTGIETVRSMGIGAARIIGAYTRDDVADPYDYTTDHPTNPTDTYGDRHLYPQIIHTPNTLRHKYDLISSKYLEDDGRYMFRPDIVLIGIGFNDHKDTTVDGYESYDDVKDLDISELETRKGATVTGKKIFTYLRLALEKLMSDEIVETRDSMTYGVDCRYSKIFFVTPMGSAQYPVMDMTYGEFGDLLEECLSDYSIKRIDGFRDFGITGRYETIGSDGRFLKDGIHTNSRGSERVGRVVSKIIMSNY